VRAWDNSVPGGPGAVTDCGVRPWEAASGSLGFFVVRGVFSVFRTPLRFEQRKRKIEVAARTEIGNALWRRLGAGTRRGVLISEVLRLPKEPVAERDGSASNWLPAICPVDSNGERTTLRSLGMKACRWGGGRSVGLGRGSDARVFAVGNLLSPARRPLFARFGVRHFRGSERRQGKTPKGLLLSAAGNHRTCLRLEPLLDRRRHPHVGVRKSLRRKINGMKRCGTSSLSENIIVNLWYGRPAAEAGETLTPQVILGQFLTRWKFQGGRGPAEEALRFSRFTDVSVLPAVGWQSVLLCIP
jgi:hypothetical protein